MLFQINAVRLLFSLIYLPIFSNAIDKKLTCASTANHYEKVFRSNSDTLIIKKIKNEGSRSSYVMQLALNLSDLSGSRLNLSSGFDKAANYSRQKLKYWGLSNVHTENYGKNGIRWELQKMYTAITIPYYRPLFSLVRPWDRGTRGLQKAPVILISANSPALLTKYKGRLKNCILILDTNHFSQPVFLPPMFRFDDTILQKMKRSVAIVNQAPKKTAVPVDNKTAFDKAIEHLINEEKALGIFILSSNTADGVLTVDQYPSPSRVYNYLELVINPEDYLSIIRILKSGQKVKMECDVKTKISAQKKKGYNVLAEIPGNDPLLKNEIVLLGAHLDSWTASTGATDNAAGCAIMMEAMRILKLNAISTKRTIQIALWGGEEQGMLGSKAYVQKYLSNLEHDQLLPLHSKPSVYFNLDNGGGRIRGIYLQHNENCRALFSDWLKAFNDPDAQTVTIRNTFETDHISFDAVNIPAFQFIQDPLDYINLTHHTNLDSYNHLQKNDMQQAAMIVAWFAYEAAQRAEKIPLK